MSSQRHAEFQGEQWRSTGAYHRHHRLDRLASLPYGSYWSGHSIPADIFSRIRSSNRRLDCVAGRSESGYIPVSMLEMKMNTTAAVDAVGLDSVNVVPDQKTRQLCDRPLIPQQIRIRRPLYRKFHGLPVVAHVDIEAELIKTHLSVDPVDARLQQANGFDEFVHRGLGPVDHLLARTPGTSPLLHKSENLL